MNHVPLFLGLFVMSTAFAWGEKPSPKFTIDNGPALSTSPEISSREPVFIFYIADVRPSLTSDFSANLDWLRLALTPPGDEGTDEERQILKRVRDYISFDLDLLRRSSELETEVLRTELCTPRGSLPSHFVLFHNSLNPVTESERDVRTYFEVCRKDHLAEGTFRKQWIADSMAGVLLEAKWQDQFLSNPVIFEMALKAAMVEFPPDKYRYILMVKGRGDAETLLKAQYGFDLSKVQDKKLRAAFLKRSAEINDKATDLNQLLHEVLAAELPPLTDTLSGLTKEKALIVLNRLGGADPRLGAFFSQVLLYSSQAPLELSAELKEFASSNDYSKIPVSNIGFLRHFGNRPPDMLPLELLPKYFGPRLPFEARLGTFLDGLASKK